jgi:acetyltransferase-like isoleucine patch superfamily enzyme
MKFLEKVRRSFNKQLPDQLRSLQVLRARIIAWVYYRHVFGSFGAGSVLERPTRLHNARNIYIGAGVLIGDRARLEAIYSTPDGAPSLIIEDLVVIENDVQLIAHCKVILRSGAGIGPRCVIMDASHPFMDVHDPRPIHRRLSTVPSFVEIGEGALIGAGTFILPNVRIGRGSVIGANSVVRKSVPNYCVASGNPAQILLRYDEVEERWVPTGK